MRDQKQRKKKYRNSRGSPPRNIRTDPTKKPAKKIGSARRRVVGRSGRPRPEQEEREKCFCGAVRVSGGGGPKRQYEDKDPSNVIGVYTKNQPKKD